MNILITSAGTRNKVVQAFRKELAGKGLVIAADLSNEAPALYDADKQVLVPRITAPDYIDCLLSICRKEDVKAVFALIDPELSLLAKNRDRFLEAGVTPIVSSYELCELCLDKYAMYERLEHSPFGRAKCWLSEEAFLADRNAGKAAFPVFIKPRHGSASIEIQKVKDPELLHVLMKQDPDLMIQELMTGTEYGCDVYIDMISHKCTSLFLKKKLRMRAGETDKSVSVKDPALFEKAAAFVEDLGFTGMIDIDLFHKEGTDEWILSEVNPRFGGGYPHAYACGVNFPKYILENLSGRENPVTIGDYEEGIYMMKYNEICVRRSEALCR